MAEPSEQIDYFHKQRQQFLAEWRTGVERHDPFLRTIADGAISFGQVALKAAFLLNGGALLAIPAVAVLFKIDAVAAKAELVWSAAWFIGGLVATWSATAMAYFTMVTQGNALVHRQTSESDTLADIYYPDRVKPDDYVTPEKSKSKEKRAQIWSEVFRWSAIVLSFISLVAFVVGVFIGGQVIIGPVSLK